MISSLYAYRKRLCKTLTSKLALLSVATWSQPRQSFLCSSERLPLSLFPQRCGQPPLLPGQEAVSWDADGAVLGLRLLWFGLIFRSTCKPFPFPQSSSLCDHTNATLFFLFFLIILFVFLTWRRRLNPLLLVKISVSMLSLQACFSVERVHNLPYFWHVFWLIYPTIVKGGNVDISEIPNVA